MIQNKLTVNYRHYLQDNVLCFVIRLDGVNIVSSMIHVYNQNTFNVMF
jgi:hypothetical protein